jgi:hypothetical protein
MAGLSNPQRDASEGEFEAFEFAEVACDRSVATVVVEAPALPDDVHLFSAEIIPEHHFSSHRSLAVPYAPGSPDALTYADASMATAGVVYQASGALFAPAGGVASGPKAPPFPAYLDLAPSHFASAKPLGALRRDLLGAFAACSVDAVPPGANGHPCAWDCSALDSTSSCAFEVAVFAASAGGHVVELRRLDGCRYAFSAVLAKLSAHLMVAIPGGAAARWGPPPLPASFATRPAPEPQAAAAAEAAAARQTGAYFCELLELTAPRAMQLAGLRAVARTATALRTANEGALALDSDRTFAGAVLAAVPTAVVALSERAVGAAASSACEDDPELAAAALAALVALVANGLGGAGNLAACRLAVAGAALGQPYHVRREALTLAEALAGSGEGRAANAASLVAFGLLRCGLGPEDDDGRDAAAARAARAALIACTA